MRDHIADTVQLANGVPMPLVGLGVFGIADGEAVQNAVGWALDAGYRHIDTASLYGNERGVGAAVAGSDVSRSDVFVTTKVWNSDQGFERTLAAFDASLARLGMEYVDLYLIHWPRPLLIEETWRALELIHAGGRARSIGVSNFEIHHLESLLAIAETRPVVNQIELHPHLRQTALTGFCAQEEIRVVAWAPLERGRVLDDPTLRGIAAAHGVSAAQVVLRWHLQRGIITIPKSANRARIAANADIFGFALDDDEMTLIDAMDASDRLGPHPDLFPGG